MNWFQRYGIPGAYFLGLIIAWIWAIYPCLLTDTFLPHIGVVVVIFFLPVGYIISVFQQWLYLKIPQLGIHGKAKKEANFQFRPDDIDDEPSIEAYSLLLAVWDKKMKLEQHKWIQDWIRRRMDVIAINFSFIIATVLAPIIVSIALFLMEWNFQIICSATVLLVTFSIFISIIMWLSREQLKKQIIIVIKNWYKEVQKNSL